MRAYAGLLLIGCSVLLFLLVERATVSDAQSDPWPMLLVSQAILEHQTIQLDAYRGRAEMGFENNYRLIRHNNHDYYYFPLGSSLFSLPFVWVANWRGLDMAHHANNSLVQSYISAWSCILVILILYQIGRCYLRPIPSLVIAAISVLGSAIISTMGTAAWNLNFAVVFVTLGLWLVARADSGQSESIHPHWLGAFLCAAYLSRPSTAAFIAVVLLYVLLKRRAEFFKVALTAVCPLLLFFLFNWSEFGQWLPPYYSLRRLVVERPDSLGVRLYGLLFSPSRGFFTFSPFFLLVAAGALWLLRPARKHTLFLLALAWFALELAIITRATRWWGGWSYGPRIMAEVIPAFILLTILLWRELSPRLTAGRRYALVVAYLTFGAVGIYINSVQGLYNLETRHWNSALAPNIDNHPEYLLNWRYPQFMASREALCRRHREFVDDQLAQKRIELAPYRPGEVIVHSARAGEAYFVGWAEPNAALRWSFCPSSAVLFSLPAIDTGRSYLLSIDLGSPGDDVVNDDVVTGDVVSIVLNDVPIGAWTLSGRPAAPATYSLPISGGWLKPGEVNELAFRFADAATTDLQDKDGPRVSFVSLAINPQGEPP